MSRICDLCARGANRANSRSHSNIATKREQRINLQTKRIAGMKARLCTKCIKTLTKRAKELLAA
ncbi:50S ribosomal protein L28 [Patescibacteria group bacterium]